MRWRYSISRSRRRGSLPRSARTSPRACGSTRRPFQACPGRVFQPVLLRGPMRKGRLSADAIILSNHPCA
jgi:hypothetical protein